MENVKKEISPKKLAKRVAKKEALAKLHKLVVASGNTEMISALKTLKPGLFGIRAVGGEGGPARHTVFAKMFEKVGSTLDEVKLFQTMKSGRKEASGFIRVGLKKDKPAERKWISFNPETGIYKLEAIGEKAPANWSGYVPAVTEDIFKEEK